MHETLLIPVIYSKTCLKQPLKKTKKLHFQSPNAGQKYCRMLLWSIFTCMLPYGFKTFVMSVFSCHLRQVSLYSLLHFIPCPVAQLVASLAADPGVTCLITSRSHTFIEIDHEIICTVILLLTLIQEGLLSVTSESMCRKYWLTA